MKVEMTTKCTDWINVNGYVELDHYLVYLNGSYQLSVNDLYCVEKETGKRELLLDTGSDWSNLRENSDMRNLARGWKLCIENLCGVGDVLYVFFSDYYVKINVATKEMEEGELISEKELNNARGVFGGIIGRSLVHSLTATKMNVQCNGKYVLYNMDNTMCLMDIATGKSIKVVDDNKNKIFANSYQFKGDKIYYETMQEIRVYDLISKKTKSLYVLPEGVCVSLFDVNSCTLNYDESTVDFYKDIMFLALYDEEEYVHKIIEVSLDGSGKVKEMELCSSTDLEEITRKLIKDGSMYYVTENEEAMIVRYDLESGEELILEEDSLCVSEEGRNSYMAGSIQIVGSWLYYQDNESENTHRIPIDGGDCVRVKVKE